MLKSLAVIGSAIAGLVSSAPVSPITVVYDTVGTDVTDPCVAAHNIKAAGVQNIVIGWFDPTGKPVDPSDTVLFQWLSMPAPNDRHACAASLGGELTMGIQFRTWPDQGHHTHNDTQLLRESAEFAKEQSFTGVYWDLSGLPSCTDQDIEFIADNLGEATAATSALPVYLSTPAFYISPDPTSFCAGATTPLLAAIAAVPDLTRLKFVYVQYYNSIVDFSTFDSIFTTAPSPAAGSAIAELNGVKNVDLKNKFAVGKLMKSSDNPNVTAPATDFIELPSLDDFICKAQNAGYTNGLALSKWAASDQATLLSAFSADCSTKSSGSGAVLMMFPVTLVVVLISML